jgi:hypothetical protein
MNITSRAKSRIRTFRLWRPRVAGLIPHFCRPAAAAVALLALGSMSPVPTASSATQIPVYWGAYLTSPDPVTIQRFEALVGSKESIVAWTQPWRSDGVYQEFPLATMQSAREHGSIPLLTWASWDDTGDANQPTFRLKSIADGTWDWYIASWARAAQAWYGPFFLRFNYEMNGFSQFPWAEQLNGNQPGDYVRAWRHVRDIFDQQGARNVSWVWCPSISGPQTVPLRDLYPDDNYVDWVCMDGYNFGGTAGYQWQTFADIFGGGALFGAHNTYQELLHIAPNKPMMIGGAGTATEGGDAAAWVGDMLNNQLPEHFPQVKAVIWAHPNPEFAALDRLLDQQPTIRDVLAKSLSTGHYAANDFATLNASPINPLGLPLGPGTVQLLCIQDTYTSNSSPDLTQAGSATILRSDAVGTDTAFMRFDMTGLLGHKVTNVVLQIHTAPDAGAGSSVPHTVKLVLNNSWKEVYMSFSNTPPVSDIELGSLVAPASDTTYQISLWESPFNLYAGRQVSVAIDASSTGALLLSSRESGDGTAPRLIVTYE